MKRVGIRMLTIITVKEKKTVPNAKSLLIGIGHGDDMELRPVFKKLAEIKPKKVGLELPDNYQQIRKAGITDGFFFSIADALEDKGVEVVPLETYRAHFAAQTRQMAEEMVEGRGAQMEEFVNETRQISPEAFAITSKEFERAKRLLRKGAGVIAELDTRLCRIREVGMLRTIEKVKPEVAIMGFYHADAIIGKLPEFNYIAIRSQDLRPA